MWSEMGKHRSNATKSIEYIASKHSTVSPLELLFSPLSLQAAVNFENQHQFV